MTRAERFDDRLGSGLTELAEPRFPDYYHDVLAVTSRTRQRPAWTFPGRWIPMVDLARRPAFVPALPWRGLTLLAVMLLLVSLLALVITGSQPRVPAPFGPARNGQIAYSANGDLYVGLPDGSSRLVLSGSEEDLDPGFSRSGTRLFFIRAETGGFSLWTIRPDGTHLAKVTATKLQDPFVTEWGPTDDTIYYTAPIDGKYRLHVTNADGSGTPTIIAPDLEITSLSFQPPDGRQMVVRGEDQHGVGLYLMNADGTNRRTLRAWDGTPPEEHDMGQPRFSPDGSRIAYQHWDAAFTNMRMHVIDADGSNDRVIHWSNATFEGWPIWLLDSKRLVMQRAFPKPDEYLHFGYPFVVVNADGTGEAREIGPPVAGQNAELSPDGRFLLQFRSEGETQTVIDVETGAYHTVPWQSNSYPSWQRVAP